MVLGVGSLLGKAGITSQVLWGLLWVRDLGYVSDLIFVVVIGPSLVCFQLFSFGFQSICY